VIIPLLPPTIAIVIDKQNAPKRPTFGSTPAMPEKAIASGSLQKQQLSQREYLILDHLTNF